MTKLLAPYSGYAYALMRIVVGFLFLCHGLDKVFGVFHPPDPDHPRTAFVYFAGGLELGLGALVMIGLFTGTAAFLASGMMAVAYFMGHLHVGTRPLLAVLQALLSREFFPKVNGGELAALYCFVFLYMATHGSGRWSVDALRRRS